MKFTPHFCTISEGKENILFYCDSGYEEFFQKFFAFVWQDNQCVIAWELYLCFEESNHEI